MKFKKEYLETDVCIVGGGLSGAIAALRAKEEELDVLVLEKANVYRSGNAGSGIDHVFSYIPEFHETVGYTREMMKKDQNMLSHGGYGLCLKELNDHLIDNSYERITDLEKYGLKFRFEDSQLPGKYRIVPQFHSIPTSFNFEGRDIKPILSKEMAKAGVKIINRAFVVELLKDGNKVIGALAVGAKNSVVYIVQAKTTILATYGGVDRLARNYTATDSERFHSYSICNGSGKVLAINAGADVINLEYIVSESKHYWLHWSMHAGAPGGSYWPCAQIIGENGNTVIERATAHSIDDPDYVHKYTAYMSSYQEKVLSLATRIKQGDKLYLDFSEATDEELERVIWSLENEGKCNVLLANMQKKGIKFRDIKIPLAAFDGIVTTSSCAGVYVNTRCETTVENLYAAGNEIGGMSNNSASDAIVYGYEAGMQGALKAKQINEKGLVNPKQVDDLFNLIESICNRGCGDFWRDIENEAQAIMEQYGRNPHTDEKSHKALALLDELEKRSVMFANNLHELQRNLEVMFILQTIRAFFMACLNRKTSLGPFQKEHHNCIPGYKSCVKLYGISKKDGEYVFSTICNTV